MEALKIPLKYHQYMIFWGMKSWKACTDCPNKNANRTFGIDNFQNYESL